MASRIFSQERAWLSFLLALLLFLRPGQYGKMTHSQNTTTLPPNTTAASCSPVKLKLAIKLSGTEMPGCNNTDQIPDVIQNCSLSSDCLIPSDTSPAPVNNLTAMGKTNSSVTLVWESPPCPSSACGTSSAGHWNCRAHVSCLKPGHNYTFVMYRVTEAGGCNQSASVTVTTRPSPVWNITVQNRTVDSLSVAWMSPENSSASRYNVCLSTRAPLQPNCSSTTGNSITAGHLEAGVLYTVTVYAVTSNNVCSIGNDIQNVTLPNKPRNMAVTKHGTHDLTISWDPPEDRNASAYLYRVSWVRQNSKDLTSESTNTSSYTIGGLLPGSVYDVKLVSVIQGAESAEVMDWTLTNPLPPTDFTVSTINQSAVNLSWGGPASVYSGFELKLGKGPAETLGNGTFLNETSFVWSALSPGTKYNFTLSTVAEAGSKRTLSTGISQEGATKPEPVGTIRCSPVGGGYSLRVSWPCVQGNFSEFLVMVSGQEPVPWRRCEDPVEVGDLRPARSYWIQVATVWNELQTDPPFRVKCDTDSTGVIVGALFAVLVLVVLLGLLLLLCFRRRSEKVSEKPKANVGPPCVLASVPLSAFPCYCGAHFSDSAFGFAQEYQQLQDTGTGQPHTVAALPENREKNRYSNVLPYDGSRVKIQPSPRDPNSDYINASYIPGYYGEKDYIATQGPLPGTVHDFWRMVWEQRVTSLVMLTNCIENGRVKCERYWPLDYTPCTYEDITVSVIIETILPDWTIRDFTIKRKNEGELRLARHYHYTSWPDHEVPSVTSAILRFRDLVRAHRERRAEGGPAVVHCSAGVGRTGTFIALDTLLSQAQKEGRIGVYPCVQRMRMHRPLMIQTESQYVFLHQCLLDWIQPPPPDTHEKMLCTAVYENTLAFQDYEVSRV